MKIIAHGIDLVDFPRLETMIQRHGGRFLNRVFTKREQSDADSVRNRIEKLAGRFAAKEAVLKVLGTGWGGGANWTDVEIRNLPSGKPEVLLSGQTRRIADELGLREVLVSISHIKTHAIASAIGLTGSGE